MLKRPLRLGNAALQFNLGRKRNLIKVGHRITHRCNYRCSYCSLWQSPGNELTTAQILNLVDEIADLGCVMYAISGGEPLIREDLPLFLKRIKSRGMISKIVTNGSLVSQQIDAIGPHIDVINFSIDTLQQDTSGSDEVIKLLTDTVIDGIKAAVEVIPHVGLNMVLTSHSNEELEEIVVLGTELGIQSFTFFPLISHYNYKTPTQLADEYSSLYNSMENYQQAVAKLKKLRSQGYAITMSSLMLNALADFKIPVAMKCIAGYLSCSISPDGCLGTCYEFHKETTKPYGEKNFAELWHDLGGSLQAVDNCPGCLFHCYFEPNAIFSLRPEPFFSYGKRYFKTLFG